MRIFYIYNHKILFNQWNNSPILIVMRLSVEI